MLTGHMPAPRGMGRTATPAACRVARRPVPLPDLVATYTHAWLMVLPRPRARGVDWDGIRAPPCFQVAPGHAPSAAAAYARGLERRYVLGAGPRLVPKLGC
jgi:hypothetical protein